MVLPETDARRAAALTKAAATCRIAELKDSSVVRLGERQAPPMRVHTARAARPGELPSLSAESLRAHMTVAALADTSGAHRAAPDPA